MSTTVKSRISRRQFLQAGILAGAGWILGGRAYLARAVDTDTGSRVLGPRWSWQIAGGTLSPNDVTKFVMPLVKPPPMPGTFTPTQDNYQISVRQFRQQILPPPHPVTRVWSYGSIDRAWPAINPVTGALTNGTLHAPSFTVAVTWNKGTQVLWENGLVDSAGNFRPHLLPVDQTLHWANPPGGIQGRDMRGSSQLPYRGPVPIVTHVHGAHTTEDSDGFPEAWYLPDAANIPAGYATTGTFFDVYNQKYNHNWPPGAVTFRYPNDEPASALWYHDHTLGITRLNVYAGPAGFYIIRGGPYDMDMGYVAPTLGDNPLGEYTEIPLAIQDRSFNTDGSLFYPDNRAFFEELNPAQLQIPFIPDLACDGQPSDVSPIWTPEFFGNMIMVNGRTWPYLEVEQRRYRFRILNGCNSRFLILRTDNGMPFYQLGADEGFLPAPIQLSQLLMGPAERADVVMDFTNVPVGTEVILTNVGPDEPFGGGEPGDDFEPADPNSTGLVMQFRVKAATGADTSVLPATLPAPPPPGPATVTRDVSLNEEESATVRVSEDEAGNIFLDCASDEVFGPVAALLGTLNPDGTPNPLGWGDPITENPVLGTIEEWAIHNFTEDAHPIHIHLVHFRVVNREDDDGNVRGPEPWEMTFKDTVIAYPGEITRVRARFDVPGQFVWHCHILEHEDNEMMRPYLIGPAQTDLVAFNAVPGADQIDLVWETRVETNTAGFNVYRATAPAGPYTQLNPALIPAQGDPSTGASYAFGDTDVTPGIWYYYRLEVIDTEGASTLHGPATARLGGLYSLYLPQVGVGGAP